MTTPVIRLHDYERDPLAGLSERRRQVAELMTSIPPRSDREIASILEIEVNTVNAHATAIRQATGVRNRSELIQRVERWRTYREVAGLFTNASGEHNQPDA